MRMAMIPHKWGEFVHPHQYNESLIIARLPTGGLTYYNPAADLFYGGIVALAIVANMYFSEETKDYLSR